MIECEIVLEDHVDVKRFYGFELMTVHYDENGTTVITGDIPDRAMLFALLTRIRDLGLKLKAVKAEKSLKRME